MDQALFELAQIKQHGNKHYLSYSMTKPSEQREDIVLATVDLYLSQLTKEVQYLPTTVRLFFRALVLHDRRESQFHFLEIVPSQEECRTISKLFM